MRTLWVSTLASFLLSAIAAQMADTLLNRRIPIIGEFMGLENSQNPGIAFGIRFQPELQTALILIAIVAVSVLAVQSVRNADAAHQKLHAVGFGLILGGGIGNIVDRLQDGYVTDFLQIGWWPVFNVADSFVTIGVGLLIMAGIVGKKGDKGTR